MLPVSNSRHGYFSTHADGNFFQIISVVKQESSGHDALIGSTEFNLSENFLPVAHWASSTEHFTFFIDRSGILLVHRGRLLFSMLLSDLKLLL